MKKTLYLFAIIAFTFACSAPKEEAETTTEPEEESIYSYTGNFEMGDPANQQLVRDINAAFVAGDMEALASMMADSLTFYWADGSVYSNVKDSAMAMISGYRSSLTSVDVVHLAGMAINSKDHDHNWSLSWTMETHTSEEGSQMAVYAESWLIEDGKARAMRQYKQIPNQADAPDGNEPEEEVEYTYSGSFKLGDPALVDGVIALNEGVATPVNYDAIAANFADSVTIIGHDGWYFNGSRDSLMTLIQEWLPQFTSITNNYIASVSVTSHLEDDWVLLWYESKSEKNDGTIEEGTYHDDYLMVDGKIRLIRGYMRGDWKKPEAEESETES